MSGCDFSRGCIFFNRGHRKQAWYELKDNFWKSGDLNFSVYPTAEMQTEGVNIGLSQILIRRFKL